LKHCELTLPTPAENLAADEALLDWCEAGQGEEVLRFWESAQYFVVVGYANRVLEEVNRNFCGRNSIPVLRRCTGGGTVLQGPGCLNYSLVLRIGDGPFQSIPATNEFILQRHQEALAEFVQAPIERCGQTDLAAGGMKFCGNAQRRRKNFLLFHGSFLLHMDIAFIEETLLMPSKQPDYRANRSHADFLKNLKVPAEMVKGALARAWGAGEMLTQIPFGEISRLACERYGRDEWNLKF
jgi:lipoate-protein ligase A